MIGGVRGTYDRHAYHAEKKQAFEALAGQIDRILKPADNVVPMRNFRNSGMSRDKAGRRSAGNTTTALTHNKE